MLKDFAQIKQMLAKSKTKRRLGLVAAQDENSLGAIIKAKNENLIEPVLIGDEKKIKEMLENQQYLENDIEIYNVPDEHQSVLKAIELVRDGQLDCVMKGRIETSVLMRPLVSKETGIRIGNTMFAVGFIESPYYHKIFGVADAGLIPHPTLEQKKDMIVSTTKAFHKIGVEKPKISILTAVEHPNEKMPETLDAKKLKDMADTGQISGCYVEGPISYDLAMDKEAADIKGYKSPVAGDTDLLIVPNLVTGNSLFKALVHTGNAKYAGAIFGGMVPIILTSRSASLQDKYLSILLNSYFGRMEE